MKREEAKAAETAKTGTADIAAENGMNFEDHIVDTLNTMIFEYANEAELLKFKGLMRGSACIETMHKLFGDDNPELASCREQYGTKNCLDCVPGAPGCFIAAHKEEICEACEEHSLFDEDTDSFVCRYGETDPMRGVAGANWRKSVLIIAKQILTSSGIDGLDWEQVRSEEDSRKGIMGTTWDIMQSMRDDSSH